MNRSQEEARAAGLELIQTSEGLALTDGTMQLIADFAHMIPRLKQGTLQRELLVRAARARGVEDPVAFDATAGFGEDSLLLAAAGYTVEMFECNPVISALLADALERAASDPRLSEAASHMHLHVGDSIAGMAELVASLGTAVRGRGSTPCCSASSGCTQNRDQAPGKGTASCRRQAECSVQGQGRTLRRPRPVGTTPRSCSYVTVADAM